MSKSILGYPVLLATAALFGLAFIFQHHAATVTSPLWFLFWRFLLATITLAFCWGISHLLRPVDYGSWLFDGAISGIFMFSGMYLQQKGLAITTVGKSGFLTGLYVVLVPLFALLLGRKPEITLIIAVALSCLGLYLFSDTSDSSENLAWNFGDTITLISAVFWALQVLWIERSVRRSSILPFSVAQIGMVAILALIFAIFSDQGSDLLRIDWMRYSFWDIVATGIGSSALAFFLQAVGQRRVSASYAAIILSFESVFALFFGWLFLNEIVSNKMLIGCTCLFLAMLLAQFDGFRKAKA